jgi:hypothetical protein
MATVASWLDLRQELRRLERRSPAALRSYPSLDVEQDPRGPFDIELVAHAEEVAAELHARYGDLVSLHVGLLPYPGPEPDSTRRTGEGQPPVPWFLAEGRSDAQEYGLTVGLAGPSSPPRIRSGFAEEVLLAVSNRSGEARHLQTSGFLHTYVVDGSGTVVGCDDGLYHPTLEVLTVRPEETADVPSLVGTASMLPTLGYAVPPGDWHFVAELTLGRELDAVASSDEVTVWSGRLPLVVMPTG